MPNKPQVKFDAERIAELMVSPRNNTEIAAALGVDQGNFQRWLRKPELKAAIEEQKELILTQARVQVLKMTPDALKALHTLIKKGNIKAITTQLEMTGLAQAQVASSGSTSLTVVMPTGVQVPEVKTIDVTAEEVKDEEGGESGG